MEIILARPLWIHGRCPSFRDECDTVAMKSLPEASLRFLLGDFQIFPELSGDILISKKRSDASAVAESLDFQWLKPQVFWTADTLL